MTNPNPQQRHQPPGPHFHIQLPIDRDITVDEVQEMLTQAARLQPFHKKCKCGQVLHSNLAHFLDGATCQKCGETIRQEKMQFPGLRQQAELMAQQHHTHRRTMIEKLQKTLDQEPG